MRKTELDPILMQNILHHGNIGIHVIDRERNTKVYNQTMADLEGLEITKVMDKDILEIFPSLDERSSTLIKVINTGEPIINSTQTYLNYRGNSITTISTTLPLLNNGTIVGAMEIAQDMTNLRQLSEQLFDLQKELTLSKPKGKKELKIRKYHFTNIIGNNEKLLLAKKIGSRASLSNSSVLIYGETGTGKEMFAQSIHNNGIRKDHAFIAQNCAAIPESLLEGILFGTDKGGFTGAVEREGIFEQANGGTLLLDEINSMSLPLQAKLLRVLQEGYIRRIGGLKDIPIDVRILATTNEDPKESINKGILRRDLFYRLSVINIYIPPLRERLDDIEALSQYFINKYNNLINKKIEGLSGEVLEQFKNYSWLGNIRELENFIEGAMNMVSPGDKILNKEDFISASLNPLYNSNDNKIEIRLKDMPLPNLIEDIEKNLIQEALEANNNNITNAANYLGIKRQTLQHKIKKYSESK